MSRDTPNAIADVETVTIAGYSDDIVRLHAPPFVDDEFYANHGDEIHLYLGHLGPDDPSPLVIRPFFGNCGWEFRVEVPSGTHVEYLEAKR